MYCRFKVMVIKLNACQGYFFFLRITSMHVYPIIRMEDKYCFPYKMSARACKVLRPILDPSTGAETSSETDESDISTSSSTRSSSASSRSVAHSLIILGFRGNKRVPLNYGKTLVFCPVNTTFFCLV